jgi:ABC-type transporter MlaC component
MKKFAFLTLVLVVALTMTTSVWAADPTGELAVIQKAADNYLSTVKAATISADALYENLNDGDILVKDEN